MLPKELSEISCSSFVLLMYTFYSAMCVKVTIIHGGLKCFQTVIDIIRRNLFL